MAAESKRYALTKLIKLSHLRKWKVSAEALGSQGNEKVYTFSVLGGVPYVKRVRFTMKLEAALRDEFMAEAEAAHRPASQIMRDLMREFVQRQREARKYEKFLRRKVDTTRSSVRANRGRSHETVEAEFAARRADLLRDVDGA